MQRPDGARVTGRPLELDEGLAADALALAAADGLPDIELVRADAGGSDSYAGAAPADLVLMCGVFGNVTDDDLRATVLALPSLCAPGATVIWTRAGLPEGDPTGVIRECFAVAGFEEVAFDSPEDARHRTDLRPCHARCRPAPCSSGSRDEGATFLARGARPTTKVWGTLGE